MEDLYDVLVEIRDELANIKEELRAIRGVGGYWNDLNDIHRKLEDIEDVIKYNR